MMFTAQVASRLETGNAADIRTSPSPGAVSDNESLSLPDAAGSRQRRRRLARFAPCALALALAACGTDLGVASTAIVNGTPVMSAETSGMVHIASDGGCSGTLLARQWVLTAAHCVFPSSGPVAPPITVTEGNPGSPNQALADAIYPYAYHGGFFRSDLGYGDQRRQAFDVALLHLSTALTMPTSHTVTFNTDDDATLVQLQPTVTCYGYGQGLTGALTQGTSLVSGTMSTGYRLTAAPQNPSQGDSGGSCFLHTDSGNWLLTGVQSWVIPGSYPFGTPPDTYQVGAADISAWANIVINGPVSCGNGVCDPGENGATCARDCCDANTPCSATYLDQNTYYCRSMAQSATNPQWRPFAWLSSAQYNGDYCSASQRCASLAKCAATTAICADPNNLPHWAVLPATTCP